VTTAKAEGVSATLVLAADAFVVRGADGPDVVTGYPGGGPGGTMAGYEGLFLATGRVDEGRELLLTRTRQNPGSEPDAPLWLIHAVERHVTRTGDTDLAARLAAPLGRLLRRRLAGAGPLGVDPADELLRLDGPRTGKPVEINALWVNALAALADLLLAAGRDDGEARARHARARASFRSRFPAPEGWLHDVVEGPPAAYPLGLGSHHDDPTLRPHQLLAWSLPYAPMTGEDPSALRALGPALLTPLGLRTLSPGEYGYQSADDQQGAVWPWLIGPYSDACAAAGLPTDGLVAGLEAHVAEWGAGSVSERADGDPPHRASGDPFHARSVAELLRVREVGR
jgi:glycogen debranching enzyme